MQSGLPVSALMTADDAREVPFFIARQPIYNRRRKLHAYELLFRGQETADTAGFLDGSSATAQLITQGAWLGNLRALSGGRPLFINFTRDLLVNGSAALLDPRSFVIEVLEDVPPEPAVLKTCAALLEAGFRVAVDDVVDVERLMAFEGVTSLVKVDLMAADRDTVEAIAREAKRQRIELLAEKVETQEDLDVTSALGFHYFQGFFLSRPESVKRSALPGLKPIHVKLLDIVSRPNLDVDEVARTVEADPSLTYMLLRRANAASLALNRRISSMRDVVVLFGHDEIRRSATFVVMGAIVGGSDQLLHQSVTIARFCDNISQKLKMPPAQCFDFYLVGLLSNVDALLGEPMRQALKRMPLAPQVVAALAYQEGAPAAALGLARSYMQGEWDAVRRYRETLGLAEDDVPPLYLDAVERADEAMAATR